MRLRQPAADVRYDHVRAGGNYRDGPVTIDHGGSVNIRNAVNRVDVELHSQATSVSAILGTSSNAAVLATVGNIVLDAPQGGINFSLSDLTAAADITLSAGTAITVKTVNAGDDFSSLGATTFNTASSGSQITAVGDVTVNHTGTVTFRGPITGKSISLTSAATTAAAINGINTSATLLRPRAMWCSRLLAALRSRVRSPSMARRLLVPRCP